MSKIYPHDETKIAANYATAVERRLWNSTVEENKEHRASMNRRTFVPRKSSHKSRH